MTISLFRSGKEPDVFGFTIDPTGGNLPQELGPWQSAGVGVAAQAYAGRSLDELAPSDPVMRAVKQDGFYLARSGSRTAAPHVFRSTTQPEVYAFTIDPAGTNLPVEDGPWERSGNALPLGTTMASTSPEIAQQIERYGYALVKGRTAGEPRLSKRDSTP